MEYSLSVVPDGYFTPRHRHNFDQIRYTLSGVQSTGLGDLAAGECGYFPEGSHYGPQQQKGECECLVLQFQGASGEHLLSNEEMNATYEKLLKSGGKFENGVYKGFKPDGSAKNKDSYEAIWEEHEGRDLVFPEPRYRQPVMMLARTTASGPIATGPASRSSISALSARRAPASASCVLLPGAAIKGGEQEDAELRYLLEGSCSYDGKSWGEGTYMFLPNGAAVGDLRSERGATFFVITLPMLADLAAAKRNPGIQHPVLERAEHAVA